MEIDMTDQNITFPTKEIFVEKLYDIFGKNSLDKYLDENKAELFYRLAVILVETNKNLNLTAVTDPEGIILRHFADSLVGADELSENGRIIDVGCGGGFPTFPLAIVRPDLEITAIDSTEKKIHFVSSTAKELGLGNITAISGRAEELGQGKLRESFDHATARAVASLAVLSELCIPFVKVGGSFVAMKSARTEEELAPVRKEDLFSKLGGEREPAVRGLVLVGGDEELTRTVITVRKLERTPEAFPRNYSQIMKSDKKRKMVKQRRL